MGLSTRRTRKVRSKVAKGKTAKGKVAKGKRGGAKGKTAKGKRGGAKGKGKRKVSRGKAVRANKSRRRITRKRFSKRGGMTPQQKSDASWAEKQEKERQEREKREKEEEEEEEREETITHTPSGSDKAEGEEKGAEGGALEEDQAEMEGEGEKGAQESPNPSDAEIQKKVEEAGKPGWRHDDGDAMKPESGELQPGQEPLFPEATPGVVESMVEKSEGDIPGGQSERPSVDGFVSADALGVSESPNKKKKCSFNYTDKDGKIEIEGINCNDAETTTAA